MKKWLTLTLVCITWLTTQAQVSLHRAYLFNRGNVTKLAQHINKNATSDSQRVANIHFWITHHIKYDAKRFVRWQTKNQETKDVLRRRKTLCSGYANLFQDLCLQSGVNAIVVNGYTKNTFTDICDTAYLPDHAWNKVEINGVWQNVDETWDAGYVEYYKTNLVRLLGARILPGVIRPYIYKPHFIKNPQSYYFKSPENCFAVTHYPENSKLTAFASTFNTTNFSRDSAFYLFLDKLQNRQQIYSNTYFNTYSSFDRIEQDKNDGENALFINGKNYFGLSRYHSHNLREAWERYRDDPKKMKQDSTYLKQIVVLSDSVLSNTSKNDSLIWEEYRDLSTKYRDKRKIQRDYTNDYVRYLKRKKRHQIRQFRKLKTKKHRAKNRKHTISRRYNRLLWRHNVKPGGWTKRPKQEKADSLALVFQAYDDSTKIIDDKVVALQRNITNQIDSTQIGITQQNRYIGEVTGHFHSLLLIRMTGVDDYDLIVRQFKSNLQSHTNSDSTIALDLRYRKVYTSMDSIYRLSKKRYRYTSRQRSVLKRIKRSTGNKVQYYSFSDAFRRNLQANKQAEVRIQNETKRQIKQLRKMTKDAAPVSLALGYCRSEKDMALPLDIYKSKRRKHLNDNKQLHRFAKRTRTKSLSRLEVLD